MVDRSVEDWTEIISCLHSLQTFKDIWVLWQHYILSHSSTRSLWIHHQFVIVYSWLLGSKYIQHCCVLIWTRSLLTLRPNLQCCLGDHCDSSLLYKAEMETRHIYSMSRLMDREQEEKQGNKASLLPLLLFTVGSACHSFCKHPDQEGGAEEPFGSYAHS